MTGCESLAICGGMLCMLTVLLAYYRLCPWAARDDSDRIRKAIWRWFGVWLTRER